ncbi:hypothetical protein EIP86_007441 [Pleurotus ostreatoroseus]|nr:hypothetical protein EIP86_007441 [Pleurotus ostreatoroseus]
METWNKPAASRKFTQEEKKQLLDNLDIEGMSALAHRVRQFESWLADALENFRIHQEGLVSRVPRLVRGITLRDFAKYNGDVQACLKGLQREKLGGEAEAIDKTTRKRKWVESQETEIKATETESTKGVKSARINPMTPRKAPGSFNAPGTGQRSRLPTMKTPGTARMMHRIPSRGASPSPHKPTKSLPFPRMNTRPASPTKPPRTATTKPSSSQAHAMPAPSVPSFNPSLPNSSSFPRWPRKDEHMLSVNGSPLANPLALDLNGWLSRVMETESEDEHDGKPTAPAGARKRTNSIIIRSTSQQGMNGHDGTAGNKGPHSRTNSQTSIVQGHSRSNSRANGFVPTRNAQGSSTSTPPLSHSQPQTHESTPETSAVSTPSLAALVAVPTQDGHLLEFNPFETSPDEIDALEGISDTAKQQAKQDIARLVMQAVQRWSIAS